MPIKRPLHRRSPAFRRRVVLALAAAEDRITRAYASAATAFLLDLGDDLPFDQALDIFMRLASVPSTLHHAVTVRTLADIANSRIAGYVPLPNAPGENQGRLHRWVRRLRGRRRDALRERIRTAIGPAREAIYRAHLHGLALVADATRDTLPPPEAVQLYIDALRIEPRWAARIFHDALADPGRWAPGSASPDTVPSAGKLQDQTGVHGQPGT